MDIRGEEFVLSMSASFPVFLGRGKITPNNICTAIVSLGVVGPTFRLGRMTSIMATWTVFPQRITSQLVGHLLGDGHIAK